MLTNNWHREEQNRTCQPRTEQNRTEQNRTEFHPQLTGTRSCTRECRSAPGRGWAVPLARWRSGWRRCCGTWSRQTMKPSHGPQQISTGPDTLHPREKIPIVTHSSSLIFNAWQNVFHCSLADGCTETHRNSHS